MISTKKMNVHYYLLFGIILISLGTLLFIINFYNGVWVNIIPSHPAPIFSAIILFGMGLLLIIAWTINLKKGNRFVSQ